MPGVFPDYPAPVVRNTETGRELAMMRWGMPPPPRTDKRRDLYYELRPEGEGQRILAHAITERFGRTADRSFAPITEGATLPVVHAGIVEVVRFSFLL
jgi:hypothetical protein